MPTRQGAVANAFRVQAATVDLDPEQLFEANVRQPHLRPELFESAN